MIDKQQVVKECRRQGWSDAFIDKLVDIKKEDR